MSRASDDSISRVFASWTCGLRYEDIPAAVQEKIKGLVLLQLVSGAIGAPEPHVAGIVDLVMSDERREAGCTILGHGTSATCYGAATANVASFEAGRLLDSFRMLTHPGPVLVATGLAAAELAGKTGRDLATALVAGYEVACRLSDDFVPAVSAHGFRPSGIFGTMGAAVVAAKLFDLDEDGTVAAIAIAANSASGLNEPARTGGGERFLHEVQAARQGLFAARMAPMCGRASELAIEGRAGFYNAFAGSHDGRLTHAFDGPRKLDLRSLVEGLGDRYTLLDVMFKIYDAGGFNQPVIELIAALKRRHGFAAQEVKQIVVTLNYLETVYPSPDFPRLHDASLPPIRPTAYFAAHTALHGRFPTAGSAAASTVGPDDPVVTSFMNDRVTVVGVHDQPMFSPTVSITTRGGQTYAGSYPYEGSRWSFDELAGRLVESAPGLPGESGQLVELEQLARCLDELETLTPIFEACELRAGVE